ncbi:MAG: hypothetical protein Q8O22_01815 [Candidatus Omnitrophota bacterium]|nr:hypothetical protein [Candidatus Omnitrophota bacterium]
MSDFLAFLAVLYPFYFLILLFSTILLALKKTKFAFPGRAFFVLIVLALILRVRYSEHMDLDPYCWGYILDAGIITNFFSLQWLRLASLANALHIPGYAFLEALPLSLSFDFDSIWWMNILASVAGIFVIFQLAFKATKSFLGAFFSAALLAFSTLHIRLSGLETPMPVSTLLVMASFFYLGSGTESNRRDNTVSLLLLLMAVNIKLENIVFFGVFLLGIIRSGDRKTLKWSAVLLCVTAFFALPYFINHHSALKYIRGIQAGYAGYSMYGLPDFFKNLAVALKLGWSLIIIAPAGYFLLRRVKKETPDLSMYVIWLFCGLILFSFYDKVSITTNLMQISLPVYCLFGYCLSEAVEIIFHQQAAKRAIAACVIMALGIDAANTLRYPRQPDWRDLKKQIPLLSPRDCVITLGAYHAGAQLRLIFPRARWIFFEDRNADSQIASCRGQLYYLNPVNFGLQEETDNKNALSWEQKIRDRFVLTRIGRIDFFRLGARQDNP